MCAKKFCVPIITVLEIHITFALSLFLYVLWLKKI